MNIFGININIKLGYWKLILMCVICLLILGFFIWLVSSYYIYKWLKMSIDKDYYYFNQYNNDCSEILDTYGDYSIKRIYLVRQPITKFAKILLNLITFYKFEKSGVVGDSRKTLKNQQAIVFKKTGHLKKSAPPPK